MARAPKRAANPSRGCRLTPQRLRIVPAQPAVEQVIAPGAVARHDNDFLRAAAASVDNNIADPTTARICAGSGGISLPLLPPSNAAAAGTLLGGERAAAGVSVVAGCDGRAPPSATPTTARSKGKQPAVSPTRLGGHRAAATTGGLPQQALLDVHALEDTASSAAGTESTLPVTASGSSACSPSQRANMTSGAPITAMGGASAGSRAAGTGSSVGRARPMPLSSVALAPSASNLAAVAEAEIPRIAAPARGANMLAEVVARGISPLREEFERITHMLGELVAAVNQLRLGHETLARGHERVVATMAVMRIDYTKGLDVVTASLDNLRTTVSGCTVLSKADDLLSKLNDMKRRASALQVERTGKATTRGNVCLSTARSWLEYVVVAASDSGSVHRADRTRWYTVPGRGHCRTL